MMSARVRAARRAANHSAGMLLCRRSRAARESVRDQYVRIKKEKGCPTDACGELIDLADSSDERTAGRYDVSRIEIDDGTSVELIEILSDADDEAEQSEAETIDLCDAADGKVQVTSATRRGSTIHLDLPPVTVDLTRSSNASDGGLLCAYEQIYVDLAQSSSSDDYESSDSSDEADVDSDREGSETDTPRALMPRRRVFKPTAFLDKKVIRKKTYAEITELEIRKPWRFVYRCLEIPFKSTPRTDSCGFMFELWDDFWHEHGRAVWERMFWKPMEQDSGEYKQRHNRQSRAMKAFRRLANDLHQKYDLKLVELVKAKPHSGWWYRSKRPVDLVRLRCQDSRLYALHLSRYRERWPFGVRYVQLHCNSCWCLPEAATPDHTKNGEHTESDDTDEDDGM